MGERERWFRARFPDQGAGYGLAHWKGAVAVGVWAALTTLAVLVSFGLFGATLAGTIGAILAFGVAIGALVLLVRARSDWNG